MDEIKVTNATYIWVDSQTPGLRLDLDLASSEGPQHVIAVIGEIRPSLFEHGLVYLHGKSKNDVELLRRCLSPKEIPDWPGMEMEGVTNNSSVVKLVRHLIDAANYRNGARFEEGKSIPQSVWSDLDSK